VISLTVAVQDVARPPLDHRLLGTSEDQAVAAGHSVEPGPVDAWAREVADADQVFGEDAIDDPFEHTPGHAHGQQG
jgi:hypothetical protein